MTKHKNHRHAGDESRDIDDPSLPDDASPEYSPEDYEALIAERDDLRGKYQRALADYQNAQRRFTSDMGAAREAGVERVLASLIPVLDHFDLALAHDPSKVAAEQIVAGVRMIRDEFNRAMAAFGVSTINPALDAEFDPAQHEALSQVPTRGVRPGHVSSVYQVGYKVGDRVIRPAKITVAPAATEPPESPAS
ncbi:MAG: nucleotide exchange factor GrpE [Phycisphaerales bacterium]|nr:nucleotide exchange factor GrpE [Phycisphaerales bacterium]